MDALTACRSAPPVVRSLIELHYRALSSTRLEGRLFFYTKALELVRALLPGADLRAKSGSLPASVSSELARSLAWLYDMSNNRFDVRHVVKNPRGPALHPEMTQNELRDFEHDADLVIRVVVADHLSIDFAIIRTR